jgi:hypothetical protein
VRANLAFFAADAATAGSIGVSVGLAFGGGVVQSVRTLGLGVTGGTEPDGSAIPAR